jgi:hypothetical protein
MIEGTAMRQGRRLREAERSHRRWLNRFVRGRRPDRNPLRRRSDRVETYLLAGTLAAGIAGAPFAAQAAGHAAYASALRVERAQHAASHQVKATLLQPAGSTTANGLVLDAYVPTQARWTSVTGVVRTGQLMAAVGTSKGATVTVWTNVSGTLVTSPLEPSQVASQADMAAAGAIIGIGLLYLCQAVVIRQVLNRRRIAAWDADWTLTEPMWSRQSW